MARFRAAMDEDFDVAGGLGVLFDVVRDGNRRLDDGEDIGELIAVYDEIMGMLALDERSDGVADLADLIGEIAERHGAAANVDALLDQREQARTSGDFEAGDSIRDELAEIGIVVEDTADGARWHRR